MTWTVDQVVVNDGLVPLGDLYFALKPKWRNKGLIDYDALGLVKDIYNRRAEALALEAGRIERRKLDRGGTSGDEVGHQSSRHTAQLQS